MQVFSYSKLKAFEQCPCFFQLKYLERKKPMFKATAEQACGNAVHESIEKMLKEELVTAEGFEKVLGEFENKLEKRLEEKVLQVKEFDFLNFGRKQLACFFNQVQEFQKIESFETIAVEQAFWLQLKNCKFQGFIDWKTTQNGVIHLHDFKNKTPKDFFQLECYALSLPIQEFYPLHYHNLAEGIITSKKQSSFGLKEVWLELEEKIARVQEAVERKEFARNESSKCNWCVFKQECLSKQKN